MTYLVDLDRNIVFIYSVNEDKYLLFTTVSNFKMKETNEIKIIYSQPETIGE